MYVIGCDVGSGSVRVAIIQFNSDNTINDRPVAIANKTITVYNPLPDYYEQKSEEIWDAVCHCIRECVDSAAISGAQIAGIAFSSTCSLVVVDRQNRSHHANRGDVIMWMDHRAVSEANAINESRHEVLKQFGGYCSPEFSLSKLVWLRNNQFDRFSEAIAFLELPDWLSWKCVDCGGDTTSSESIKNFPRSLCSVTCKWGYDAQRHRWPNDLFEALGLNQFVADKSKIGDKVIEPGKRIGYVSVNTAKQFGLKFENKDELTGNDYTPISVSSPIIDAHSGVLAMLAFSSQLHSAPSVTDALNYDSIFCMIAGTSTCHFVSTRDRQFTRGVWGPYYSVIFPDYFVREAGQSATGKLIEHVIASHPQWQTQYSRQTDKSIASVIKQLNSDALKSHPMLNKLHVNPCFHGNRSPLANPLLRGSIYGLTLEAHNLLDCYHATVEALAYETKYILDELKVPNLKMVLISGGLAKNELYMQIHADVLNTEVITFGVGNADLMLVGAAILARHSALNTDLSTVCVNYPQLNAKRYKPTEKAQHYHSLKYKCFRELLDSATKIEAIMSEL